MGVFTEVSEQEISALLKEYSIGDMKGFFPIAEGIDNTNYYLDTTQGQYVFTLFEGRVQLEDLPFIFGFMEYLQGLGVHCPAIIRNNNRSFTSMLNGRTCVIASFIHGRIIPIEVYSLKQIESAAAFLARMHMAADSYKVQSPNRVGFDEWERLLQELGSLPDTIEQGLTAYLQEKIRFLKSAWPSNLPKGVVHADYFPNNLFLQGDDVLGVIDFYFTCTDFYLYDLAIAYNAFCFEDGQYLPERGGHFMEAYQSVRKLSEAELQSCKLLAQGAALRILMTRLHHYLIPRTQSCGTQKDPREYLRILKFHEQS